MDLNLVGFGNLAPETWEGKLFCIFYALLGVPINVVLVGSISTLFSSRVRLLSIAAGHVEP